MICSLPRRSEVPDMAQTMKIRPRSRASCRVVLAKQCDEIVSNSCNSLASKTCFDVEEFNFVFKRTPVSPKIRNREYVIIRTAMTIEIDIFSFQKSHGGERKKCLLCGCGAPGTFRVMNRMTRQRILGQPGIKQWKKH